MSEQSISTDSGSICVVPLSPGMVACDKIKLAHSSNSEGKIYDLGKKQNVRKKGTKDKTNLKEVTMNSKSEGWTLIISANIGDIPCQVVIDTAAQVTVINEELYQRLKSPAGVIEHVNLKDVTAKNMIPAKLLKSVDIKLGSKCYPWNIYVANIADEGILGLDFLKAKQGIVNLHRNELALCNKVIPALLKRNTDGAQHQVSRVRLKKRLVLPPHTMKVQYGIVENDHLEMCSFSSTTSSKFIAPHTIVQVRSTNEIPVCLWNSADKFCTLKQNRIIGSCTEAELLPESETNHMVRSVKNI